MAALAAVGQLRALGLSQFPGETTECRQSPKRRRKAATFCSPIADLSACCHEHAQWRERTNSMEYQDQKLRAIVRLIVIATALSVMLALSLIFSEEMRRILQHLPFPRWRDGNIWLGVLFTMVPICWAVSLLLIFTSPEQEVRLVAWSKRWLKTTSDFERITFDERDPDYRKAAWRYFLDRHKSDPS